MKKYLIVNADDFGMCQSANTACFELFEAGRLYSATIMMPCPAAKAAVDFSVANPRYAVGIHTTLTSEWQKYRWKPLTSGKTLVDEEGFMWHEADMVEKHAAAAALSKIWAKKYKVITPDYLLSPDWDAPGMKDCEEYEDYRKRILEIWSDIPDGVTETFVHPSVESDELKSITNAWQRRVWEYMLLKDPETEKFLNEHGVYFISYRDLVDLRFGIKEP